MGVNTVIASKSVEGLVDSGVKILISVVIGALLLGGLYALFNDTIIPTLGAKVLTMLASRVNCKSLCGVVKYIATPQIFLWR